jgi:hypothetical protein
MTPQKTKLILKFGFLFLLGLLLWGLYEFYFKFEVIAYQDKQKENDLIKNYQAKQKEFKDFINYTNSITRFESVLFGPDNSITFQIYDTVIDRAKNFESTFLTVGRNSTDDIHDIEFLDGNRILISSDSNKQIIKDWIIHYEGKTDVEIVSKLLQYNRLSAEQIKDLRDKLEKLNCVGFSKNDKLISIMKTGSLINCFNYLFPLDSSINRKNLNELSDNFYWEHYKHPSICE